jgi:hypothetical protein
MFATTLWWSIETVDGEAQFAAERQAAAQASGCSVEFVKSAGHSNGYKITGPSRDAIRQFIIASGYACVHGQLCVQTMADLMATVSPV